jgi:hypothetical protein
MAANVTQQESVARVLDVGRPPVAATGTRGAGLALWQKEREAAIGRLRQLAAAIGG